MCDVLVTVLLWDAKTPMSDAPSPFRVFEDAAREAGFVLRENAAEQLLADREEGTLLPTPAAFISHLLDVCFCFVLRFFFRFIIITITVSI